MPRVLGSRYSIWIDGAIVVALWVLAAIAHGTFSYALASVWTCRLLVDLARPHARSIGVPTWSPSEAYVQSLRRWLHARRRSG